MTYDSVDNLLLQLRLSRLQAKSALTACLSPCQLCAPLSLSPSPANVLGLLLTQVNCINWLCGCLGLICLGNCPCDCFSPLPSIHVHQSGRGSCPALRTLSTFHSRSAFRNISQGKFHLKFSLSITEGYAVVAAITPKLQQQQQRQQEWSSNNK